MSPPESTPTDGGPDAFGLTEGPTRADALRNRARLLSAARAWFATAEETVPLEAVARRAGVGIGTLYRHFPTREALVEAVYAAELDELVRAAPALLGQFPPDVALRAWMTRYAEFAATKRGMIDTLRAGWTSGRITTPATRERIAATIGTIVTAGTRAGSLRADVDPRDITALLLGVFLSTATTSAPDQTSRLLDLVVDALRPRPPDNPSRIRTLSTSDHRRQDPGGDLTEVS